MALTQERLKSILHYNPSTGIFTWINPSGRRAKSGERAGSFNTSIKYRVIGIDGVRYYEHRLAWLYMTGSFPELVIDHINCDKSDNTWSNLRVATMPQNLSNVGSWRHNTSGMKGVHRHIASGGWTSKCAGVYLGYFKNPQDAHKAYCEHITNKHGEYARVK